jgi:hypothetical protein
MLYSSQHQLLTMASGQFLLAMSGGGGGVAVARRLDACCWAVPKLVARLA